MELLENILDEWRKECCDNFLTQVATDNVVAYKEASKSYLVAIDAHTIEYINNRTELMKHVYGRPTLKW